jgi:hypothetical protein
MATIFFSYSHKDEELRDQLETHLTMLKRQGLISAWHDRRLIAGTDVDGGISQELDRAGIILLLISPDFLASDYCYSVEMVRALERHTAGQARVIPVILRPCDWTQAAFGKLLAVPRDGKPVTKWANPDDAFLDIVKAIRAALPAEAESTPTIAPLAPPTSGSAAVAGEPRSSNLRIRKTFTERDRDLFLDEGFEFIARYFENSLQEIESRNPGIEGTFKRSDGSMFTASDDWTATEPPRDCNCLLITEGKVYFRANGNPIPAQEFISCFVNADGGIVKIIPSPPPGRYAHPPGTPAYAVTWEIVTTEPEPRTILKYPYPASGDAA